MASSGASLDTSDDSLMFLDAARNGVLRPFKKRLPLMVQKGTEELLLAIRDGKGNSLLHIASAFGHKNMCTFLVKDLGMDLNNRNYTGKTPLFFFTQENIQAMKFLIKKGASINLRDNFGLTSLHYAILRDDPIAIQTLLENGADLNAKTLMGNSIIIACMLGHLKSLKALVSYKANVNECLLEVVSPLVITVMNKKYSPFFHCGKNENEIVKFLTEEGADINKNQLLGFVCDSEDLIEILLKNGADPDIHTKMKDIVRARIGNLVSDIENAIAKEEYLAGIILCTLALEEDYIAEVYSYRSLCWQKLAGAVNSPLYRFNSYLDKQRANNKKLSFNEETYQQIMCKRHGKHQWLVENMMRENDYDLDMFL